MPSVGGLAAWRLDGAERQCAADPLDRPHADPMRRCELHDAGLALPQIGPDRSFLPAVNGSAAQPLALRPPVPLSPALGSSHAQTQRRRPSSCAESKGLATQM